MRQVWIPRTGSPEVLEVREAPDPKPQAGQLRIRVVASGVNFADILARMGLYPDAPKLPAVVGYEVSGTVDAIGEKVEDFQVGDQVAAMTRFQGYSDAIVVPANQTFRVPKNLPTVDAAALPVNYLTAWLMLMRLGNLQAKQKVLIHAAAGGVGLAALQICRWRGAYTLGTASGKKHARLKEMGMDHTIDYTSQDFAQEVSRITEGQGVDIVLDSLGGAASKKNFQLLAPLGRLFLFGVSSLAPGKTRNILAAGKGLLQMPRFSSLSLMQDNRGVFGVNLGHLWDRAEVLGEIMTSILDLVEQGHIKPVVDKTFPFDQAGQAHAYIQNRKNFGKVLLVP